MCALCPLLAWHHIQGLFHQDQGNLSETKKSFRWNLWNKLADMGVGCAVLLGSTALVDIIRKAHMQPYHKMSDTCTQNLFCSSSSSFISICKNILLLAALVFSLHRFIWAKRTCLSWAEIDLITEYISSGTRCHYRGSVIRKMSRQPQGFVLNLQCDMDLNYQDTRLFNEIS